MAFHNVLFPKELAALTPKTSWKTLTVELGGGGEQRAILWSDARRRYNASNSTLTLAEFLLIEKHFNGRRASGFSFPILDRASFKITVPEAVGTGNGTYQLVVNSGDSGNAYNREVYLPRSGTVTIYDGVTPMSSGFSLTYTGASAGQLVVTGGSGIISWIGEYYIPVRYEIDEMPDSKLFIWTNDNTGLVSGPDIPMREVRYTGEF